MLLGTAAATIAVSGGASTGAQAADAMLKKAPPVQYVRICDRYGAGFFQIPGSSICLQLRGQLQSDNDYQPTHDLTWIDWSTKSGNKPSVNFQNASVQDHWGYEMTAKPKFDARTETSWGTLRAYVELKMQLDAGAFIGTIGPGAGETGAGNKTELYRGYLQWAGWTIGEADSIWSLGNFKDGDIADVVNGDKSSGWSVYYTITPSGPGLPPVKGSAPLPDGWSFSAGIDTPLKHIAKNQFAAGSHYPYLYINPLGGAPSGVGAVTGAISQPDYLARIHYTADPPGKDDQHNDQFGIGDFHLAAALHQITTAANAGGAGAFPFCGGVANCALGPNEHDTGWAASTFFKFFVPMLPGTTLGANSSAAADNIQFAFTYGHGALEYAGIGGTNGNLEAGDAYWTGGLIRDDTDARLVWNGTTGYFYDKETAATFNAQYHSILTDCTDPVKCVALTLEFNYAWVRPGDITRNTDWTLGGLGNARKMALTAELSFGVSRNGTTKPVFWRWDTEVQYLKVWQDLPCNNGGVVGLATCTPSAATLAALATVGGNKDPSTWVWRNTITFNW
jgi:hypothetical protein